MIVSSPLPIRRPLVHLPEILDFVIVEAAGFQKSVEPFGKEIILRISHCALLIENDFSIFVLYLLLFCPTIVFVVFQKKLIGIVRHITKKVVLLCKLRNGIHDVRI